MDKRIFVNGALWVLHSGAHWCHTLERYGFFDTHLHRL
ncbi:MAG: hypothetical protein AVDCRST_MAG78-3403 [uncultured Rubrobacteraceae bacterium]|uniref:Uncharacterized protein n=1 Tax=uncultured Rubrobacteraceae bacterium TaxID=349277 RepID=A0A6J4QSY4_9ACTN|nr:MAG: hypothetical protein AVDCRST_MAG78-3403 [uncultured Rubrobacteraceae bacterium]